jgi:peptide-methionine (S)-S-oxide reductase
MASTMPNFLTRLFRPLSTSTRMSLTENSNVSIPANAQKATVAAGCFWGVEHVYRRHFEKKGLLDAKVGYCGGDTKSPSYRAVCGGKTGRTFPSPLSSLPSLPPMLTCPADAEALQITFDPSVVSYRQLIEFFYKMHDPMTKDQQGPDRGSQYRSAIFYDGPEQEQVAKDVTAKVAKEWWKQGPVATELAPIGTWYDAETYHQLYLDKNPSGYECPSHFLRAFPPLSE